VALRCGVGPATRARIGSAIAEIVENACTHGYAGGEGTIELAARFERADLLITIRDAGCGFDATLNNTDPTAETRGIARARALAEEIGIESTPGVGTRVELVFRTSHVGFDENGAVDLSDHDFFTPELARRVLEALELDPRGQVFELSPALAVVVGRLLSAQVGMPDRNAEVRR
jgi:anti-sigma regulatory factor (Ser/Thr protein kinase)